MHIKKSVVIPYTTEVTINADVNLDDFDDDDLIAEMEDRGYIVNGAKIKLSGRVKRIIEQILYLKQQGRDYDHAVDDLIYHGIGRIT